MEIKSEPKYDLVNVTDLDIMFPGNEHPETYTLRDGQDSYDQETGVITFATGGTIRFNLLHAHWVALRSRVQRVPAPSVPTVPTE